MTDDGNQVDGATGQKQWFKDQLVAARDAEVAADHLDERGAHSSPTRLDA